MKQRLLLTLPWLLTALSGSAQIDGGGPGMRPAAGSGGGVSLNVSYVNAGANLSAVAAASPAGNSVFVGPGTFTGCTNLWKPRRIDWFFMNSTLDVMGNVLDHGCGIFDDRTPYTGGAVISRVSGTLTIKYCPGTNIHWGTVCEMTGHTNALGAIVVTNELSLITWTADTRATAWGPPPTPSVLYVRNCDSNTVFRTFSVFNGTPGQTNAYTLTNCPADPNTEYVVSAEGFPLYWELGTFVYEFDRIDNIGSLFLGAYGSTSTDKADLYIKGKWLNGKVYAVGRSKDWKIWLDVQEWQNSYTGLNSAFNAYSAGSHYIHANKMSGFSAGGQGGYVILLETPQNSGDTNLNVWVDIDKLSHSNGAVRVSHGALRGRIGHIEQNGPNAGDPAIFCTNISASINLSGELIAGANTLVSHGGGTIDLTDYHLLNTNRDPIYVTGNGLTLRNVSTATVSGTNSVRGNGSQFINVIGSMSGPAPHNTISVLGTNRPAFLAQPLCIVTNFGTIYDSGDWLRLLNEEWVAQPTSTTGNAGAHHWNRVVTGTLPSLAAPFVESNAWSYLSLVTTQSSSGQVYQTPNSGGVGVGVVLTNADYLAEFRIRTGVTNTSGDVATMRVGLTDLSLGTGEAANGVYAMMNTNVNTNIWVFATALGGARTFTYSPSIAANTYNNMTWSTIVIYVPAPGHTAYMFVGPDRYRLTSIATNTANLPGVTTQVGVTVQADRIASTGGLNLRTNYCDRALLWVRPIL